MNTGKPFDSMSLSTADVPWGFASSWFVVRPAPFSSEAIKRMKQAYDRRNRGGRNGAIMVQESGVLIMPASFDYAPPCDVAPASEIITRVFA